VVFTRWLCVCACMGVCECVYVCDGSVEADDGSTPCVCVYVVFV